MMAMKILLLAVLAMAAVVVINADGIEVDQGVLVLSDDNLAEAIDDHEFILVDFYAPWCGHSKALEPEYNEAASLLEQKGSNVKLAKIDATEHTEGAEKYKVQGYPTLKFFRNGKEFEYTGGRTAQDIVLWVEKKSGPSTNILTTFKDAEKFSESTDVTIIGFFEDIDGDEAAAFKALADEYDDAPFGIVTDKSIFSEFKVTESSKVVLFKKFDEGRVDYDGEWSKDSLESFAIANILPIVIKFSDEVSPKVFQGPVKVHSLMFINEKDDTNFNTFYDIYREVAVDYKGEITFLYVDASDEDHSRILEFFNINESMLPVIRLIDMSNDGMNKYVPQASEITGENLRSFFDAFKSGELKRHLMSEEVPETQDEPVTVLVGKSFDEAAFDPKKNVLVEFYAPWCGHCKQLAPVWDELGAKFAGRDDVVIAKMDSTLNELEDIQIQGFPTIKFFPASDDRKIIDYDEGRTYDEFIKFLSDQGISVDEDDTPSKDEL